MYVFGYLVEFEFLICELYKAKNYSMICVCTVPHAMGLFVTKEIKKIIISKS